jgi:hypothetical protein
LIEFLIPHSPMLLSVSSAACPAALGKREKQRLAQQQQQQQQQKKQQQQQQQQQPGEYAQAAAAVAVPTDSTAAAAAFTRLTELADLLLNAGGELGIYSNKKEQLERFAKAVLPETDLLAPPAGGDDGDDMFADEDDVILTKSEAKGGEKSESAPGASAAAAAWAAAGAAAAAGNGSEAAAAQQAPAAAAAAAAPAAPEADAVDYSSWPVKELRRFLTERGVDSSSIVEKGDLVSEVSMIVCCLWTARARANRREPQAAVLWRMRVSYVTRARAQRNRAQHTRAQAL